MRSPGIPVNLWIYRAGRDGNAKIAVEELMASGSGRPPKAHLPESQQVEGSPFSAENETEELEQQVALGEGETKAGIAFTFEAKQSRSF